MDFRMESEMKHPSHQSLRSLGKCMCSNAVALEDRIQRGNNKMFRRFTNWTWLETEAMYNFRTHDRSTIHIYLPCIRSSAVWHLLSLIGRKFSFQLMSNYANVWKHFHILYHHDHHCEKYFSESERNGVRARMCEDATANGKTIAFACSP